MPRNAFKVNPIERFPPKPRPDGRFQKRINGKLHYFGANGNRDAALAEYNEVKDRLYAGIPIESIQEVVPADAMPLSHLIADYLLHLAAERDAGKTSAKHYLQSDKALMRLAAFFPGRTVGGLRPADFARYGRYLSTKLGDYAFNRERAAVHRALHWAARNDVIDEMPKMGDGFRQIAKAVMREKRAFKLIEPAALVAFVAYVSERSPQLEAMMLLAINGGLGATDCGILKWDKVDLDGAMIGDFRRPKTRINRDVPLWPETVEALKARREKRPDAELVFTTRHGKAWTGGAVAHELAKLHKRCNEDRKALGLDPLPDIVLGDLRHTFATFASEVCDGDAWKRVMGHALPGLKETYVQTLFQPRLRTLVNHVRGRIFGQSESDPQRVAALSVRQPYAEDIRSGRKRIEVRSWSTSHRGDILICAAETPDSADAEHLPRGVARCIANLVDCRPLVPSDADAAMTEWRPGFWAWVLEDIRPTLPFRVRGQQGLFHVTLAAA